METDPRFWDCECPDDVGYIHTKLGSKRCERCDVHADNQPDSRPDEILTGEHWANALAWEYATMLPEYHEVEYLV